MVDPEQMQTTRFPAGACDMSAAHGRTRLLAGIRAGGTTLATFPKANSFQWCVRKSGSGLNEEACFVRRTVAGAAQIRWSRGAA